MIPGDIEGINSCRRGYPVLFHLARQQHAKGLYGVHPFLFDISLGHLSAP
jgi:hypothetical protein